MPRDMLLPAAPTLEGLIEWLRTKDPNEEYCYSDNEGCLIFQFLRHMGHPVTSVTPDIYRLADESVHSLSPVLNKVAIVGPYIVKEMRCWQTFGAALQEALYQKSRGVVS